MKKWIAILAVLFVVVCASGCTTQPKTYNDNGITFQYPGDWTNNWTSDIQQYSGNSGNVLVSLGKDNAGMAVMKINLGSITMNIKDFAALFKTSIQSGNVTLVSDKTRTIDGVTGYETVVKDNAKGLYGSFTLFEKNNTIYFVIIATPDNNQQTVDMILNSFKVQ